MPIDKNHWYDGWFYETVIAPNQDKLFDQIKSLVPSQSTLIDVGCGTGRMEFHLAGKCKSLLGIDLSKRNIERAKMTLLRHPDAKISFQHKSPGELIVEGNSHFDLAVLTYVMHEVNEGERIGLLKELSLLADKIIVGDYHVPKQNGFHSFLSEVVEYIAGREHYRNYRSYIANGGIDYLAEQAGLNITLRLSEHPFANQIVVLEK